MFDQCLGLHHRWQLERQTKYDDATYQAMLVDSSVAYKSSLTYFKQLGLVGLLGHINGTSRHPASLENDFQPMNANFGLFPLLQTPAKKKQRKAAYAERALTDLDAWLAKADIEEPAKKE